MPSDRSAVLGRADRRRPRQRPAARHRLGAPGDRRGTGRDSPRSVQGPIAVGQSGIRVQIEGLDKLAARLQQLEPQLIEAAKKAVEESAQAVREDTEASVRVDTGNLRKTVQIRY